jgi:O-antigen/teichoic acid export membrane protein
MRLVLCGVAALLYAGTVLLLPQPPLYQAALLVLGLTLLVRATQLNWAFVGLGEVGAQAVRDVGSALLVLAGALTWVHGPQDVVAAAAVTVIPPLLGNVFLLVVFVRRHGAVRLRFDRQEWMLLLTPAIPLAASAFLSEVYYSLDKVMLEFLRSTAEVGLYGAAYKLLTLALAPAFVLYQAFFPSLSSAFGDTNAMRERADALARVMVAVGLPLIAAGPLLAGDALTFVFGSEYAPAGPALAILLVNAGIVYVAMSFGNPLMAWNQQKPYMMAIAVGAGANVVLNVALIPALGMTGAALATVTSEVLVLAGLVRVFVKHVRFDLGGYYIRVAIASVVGAAGMAALGVALDMHVLASALMSVGGYGAIASLLGVFRRNAGAPPPTVGPGEGAQGPLAAEVQPVSA